jgi:C4-dicarboxylate-specific signal transduction histidine kinase
VILSGSLSKKILISILFVSSVVTTVTTLIAIRFDYVQEIEGVERTMKMLQVSYVDSVSRSLWDLNQEQLQVGLEGILRMPNIEFVEVRDDLGKGTSVGKKASSATSFEKQFPLVYDKGGAVRQIGTLFVTISMDEIYMRLFRKIFLIFFTQLAKTLLVSSLCYFILRRIVTSHINRIADYLKDFDFERASSDLTLNRAPSPKGREDELDVLVQAINRMKGNLIASYSQIKGFNRELETKVRENTEIVLNQRKSLEHSQKMSALGQMAGGVAHEINNPLAIIKTCSEQLVDVAQDDPVDKPLLINMAQKIEKTTSRIAKIVQGLRSFSRDGSSDPFRSVQVRPLIEETLSFCAERMKNHGVRISVDCPQTDLSFEGRATEISQVLLNLLHNADDAIAPLPDRWIQVSASDAGGNVEIRVTDSGGGISQEVQEKLFQPFFTTKEIGKGTGLGLSISLGIMQGHKGYLKIDRECPNTCFVLQLPKRQAVTASRAG